MYAFCRVCLQVLEHMKPEQIFRNYKRLNPTILEEMYRIPAKAQFLAKASASAVSAAAAAAGSALVAAPVVATGAEGGDSESKEGGAAAGGGETTVVALEWDTERLKRDYKNFKNRRAHVRVADVPLFHCTY